MSISADTLKKLARFDTPTICNVIELFDVRPRNQGYMDARIRCQFPDLPPMVGFAVTTSFRASGLPPKLSAYGNLLDQIRQYEALAGPAVMVFQDLDEPAVGATFGEIMCRTYQAFGSVGLITSGASRDLDQVRGLRYPVFSNSAICSHGYCHLLNIGLPVHVGGLYVHQGDLLHGDLNGVTTIPLEIASEIPDAASEYCAAERLMIEYTAQQGVKSNDGLAAAIQNLRQAIEKIRRRVSRSLPSEPRHETAAGRLSQDFSPGVERGIDSKKPTEPCVNRQS
jgi:4-hydroxy-4-methyl-2-oxoglutarate aldolase